MKATAAAICIIFSLIVGLIIFWHRRRRKRRANERLIRELEAIYREMDEYGVSTIEDLEAVKALERQELEQTFYDTPTSADKIRKTNKTKRSK